MVEDIVPNHNNDQYSLFILISLTRASYELRLAPLYCFYLLENKYINGNDSIKLTFSQYSTQKKALFP